MILSVPEKNFRIADHAVKAESFFARLRGMIGRKFNRDFDGMIFDRCSSIHTCWMSIPLDVIFLDRQNRVTAVYETLKPWRIAAGNRGSFSVIELPAGKLDGKVVPGDIVIFGKAH